MSKGDGGAIGEGASSGIDEGTNPVQFNGVAVGMPATAATAQANFMSLPMAGPALALAFPLALALAAATTEVSCE